MQKFKLDQLPPELIQIILKHVKEHYRNKRIDRLEAAHLFMIYNFKPFDQLPFRTKMRIQTSRRVPYIGHTDLRIRRIIFGY